MILQALKEYYDRKAADPDPGIAPPGWIAQRIDYMLTIDKEGKIAGPLERLLDKRGGKKEIGWPCLVPNIGKQALKHCNSGKDANLLWDNCGFALGVGKNGEKKQQAFLDTTRQFASRVPDAGVHAICLFVENSRNDKSFLAPILQHPEWNAEIATGNPTIAFHLSGDDPITNKFIFQRPGVKEAVATSDTQSDSAIPRKRGRCMLTGESDQPIILCHPVIKGVWGGQSSGGTIVGINKPAFCSFGKEKAANSPIGKTAVDAYTKALNHLLREGGSQRIQVGDASTVFWSEKNSDFENQFATFFAPSPDNPDRNTQAVKALLNAPNTGVSPQQHEDEGMFYVLGLSPSTARISIRFWIASPLAEMQEQIRQHFRDLDIIHAPYDNSVLSIFRLLVCTAPLGKAEHIPPNLEGDTMRAILEGLPYPATLLQSVIRRIKAEQSHKNSKTGKPAPHITYIRAALIKACINRNCRFKKKAKQEELAVSLDPNNMNIGYRLGRLFAVLERIQQAANPGINSTIRDRYYGAASGTPSAVFGTLIKLSKHHLSKLKDGLRVHYDKALQEIIDGINGTIAFPPHLSLEDQGRFAVGYYHQMQPKKID